VGCPWLTPYFVLVFYISVSELPFQGN